MDEPNSRSRPTYIPAKIEARIEYELLKYQQKWREIIISTNSIDSSILNNTINSLYSQLGYALPQIQVFGSPHAAFDFMLVNNLCYDYMPPPWVWGRLRNYFQKGIYKSLNKILWKSLCIWLDNQIDSVIYEPYNVLWDVEPLFNPHPNSGGSHYFKGIMNQLMHSFVIPEFWVTVSGWLDFCFSELGCEYDSHLWHTYQSLVQNSGWLLPKKDICIIAERPTQLLFDNSYNLHGQSALKFSDGYHLDFFHGTNTNCL